MSELLPCPFCGEANLIWPQNGNIGSSERGWHQLIWCENCGATGREWPTEAEAVAAWNRRASQAELERLRTALEPFAACAELFDFGSATRPSLDCDRLMSWNDHRVAGERGFTVGDLRAARAALSGSKE